MPRRRAISTTALLLFGALVAASVPATTSGAAPGGAPCRIRNVTQGTVRASAARAIAAAADGDRLDISGRCDGGVVIDKDLTINGRGGHATLSGGGHGRVLRVRPGATVVITHLTFRHGAARIAGGILNAGTLTLISSKILRNRAGPRNTCGKMPDPTCDYRRTERNIGGGIVNDGVMTMVATRVRHNRAGVGGGVVNRGRMTIIRSTVARNVASNWAEAWGGGIVNSGSLTIRRSTIARNTVVSGESESAGGGVANAGNLVIRDSTISQNVALGGNGGSAGALDNGNDFGAGAPGEVLIDSTTITGNRVGGLLPGSRNGGVSMACDMECDDASVTIRASIIAGNGHDCWGSFVSAGHNLIGAAPSRCRGFQDGVAGDLVGTPRDAVDPRLDRLRYNGGLTGTHALLAGSPAIGAAGSGPCATRNDQRGRRRPQGGRCDIGAYGRR
ncbi:MAG: choice-of-anchor Q domain-containing protein [Candidatus Limnocylindrales bacterium]